MTGLESLRKLADELELAAGCDELHRIHGDEGGYCYDRACNACQRKALRIIADQIEREQSAGDTTMSAYDLLPDEDREAIAWVRERGGLAEVGEYYECGRRIEPWNEQKADLYELVNACGGVEEIKKRLMPEGLEWPRFEDSEPVRFGDVVSDGDETGRVYYVTFDTVNPVIIGFTDETPDQDPGTWLEVSVNEGERVKRPVVLAADGEPLEVGQTVYVNATDKTHHVTEVDAVSKRFKSMEQIDDSHWLDPMCFAHERPVLDADGNRIEPAMDVWWICEDDDRGVRAKKLHVESIGEDGFVTCSPFNRGTWVELDSTELHVNKPFLAADGKPLREGETVYKLDDCRPYTLKRFVGDHAYINAGGSSFDIWTFPWALTHEKPDSWESIMDDATQHPWYYCRQHGVETDAVSPDADLAEVVTPFAQDLVRRAKKLAGVS